MGKSLTIYLLDWADGVLHLKTMHGYQTVPCTMLEAPIHVKRMLAKLYSEHGYTEAVVDLSGD